MARSSEQWVHPPVVARELPSAKVALWRFRIIAFVLLAVAAALAVLVLLRVFNVTGGEDPGIGASRPAVGSATGRTTGPREAP